MQSVSEKKRLRLTLSDAALGAAFLLYLLIRFFISTDSAGAIGFSAVSILGFAAMVLAAGITAVLVGVHALLLLFGKAPAFQVLRGLAGGGILALLLWHSYPDFEAKQASLGAEKSQSDARANEMAVVALLPFLHKAEDKFQKECFKDRDHDGMGEYGGLSELEARGLLPAALKPLAHEKTYAAHAYVFYLYTPEAADLAEKKWCLYAWPLCYGRTGFHTFFIYEKGRIHFREDEAFSGESLASGPPKWQAYFPGFKEGQARDYGAMEHYAFSDAIAVERWEELDLD